MPRTWFSPPVCVESERPGVAYAVTSAERAAALLQEWPERGPEWRRAVKACAAAIAGTKPAVDARSAFLAAARAADRLLNPEAA
jgi:hypothetical protein